jgi:hypothetical protein
MGNEELLKKFGPCGLNCEKCFANSNGLIKYHSMELKKNFGGFESQAKRFQTLLEEPTFGNFPIFMRVLDYFSNIECKGCREEACKLFTDCKVKECSRNHKVEFCYQCDRFPCDESGFDENLKKRWITINERIKKIGLESYYEETKNLPRY